MTFLKFAKSKVYTLGLIIAILIAIAQFGQVTSFITQNVDKGSIISSLDDDAGTAIHVATKTKWYNDNGWWHYGNVYYRIVHTMARLVPLIDNNSDATQKEIIQKNHHFYLMLTSLLALYGICILVSFLISKKILLRIISTIFLFSAFSLKHIWASMILIAHPDILLSFFIALAIFYTYKYLKFKQQIDNYFLMTIFWGFAVGTKMFAIFFLPGLLLLWFPGFTKANLKKAIIFYLVMLGFYMAIGFPQNFIVWKTLNYLFYQSQYSSVGNFSSFVTWWKMLYIQGILPFIIVLGATLLGALWNNERSKLTNYKPIIITFLISFIPFLLILTKKFAAGIGTSYYIFPIIAGLIISITLIIRFTFNMILSKFDNKVLRYIRWPITILLLTSAIIFFPSVPGTYSSILKKQLECRAEAKSAEKNINKILDENVKVLSDPYFPYRRKYQKQIDRKWNHVLDEIKNKRYPYLALNHNHYQRYLNPPNRYNLIDAPNWSEIKNFYTTFSKKDHVTDKWGQKWIKIYKDTCNWEIWKLNE